MKLKSNLKNKRSPFYGLVTTFYDVNFFTEVINILLRNFSGNFLSDLCIWNQTDKLSEEKKTSLFKKLETKTIIRMITLEIYHDCIFHLQQKNFFRIPERGKKGNSINYVEWKSTLQVSFFRYLPLRKI